MPDRLLYQMIVNGEEEWLSLRDAYVMYDSGFLTVSFGPYVLEDGERRLMTSEEKQLVSDKAEEYSASK